MTTRLLLLLCCVPIFLAAQPTLTLDYFFQNGKYEYRFLDIESSVLDVKGADVTWDFSKGDLQHQFTYELLEWPSGNNENLGYIIDTQSIPDKVNKLRIQGFGFNTLKYEFYAVDSSIHLLKRGHVDYDIGSVEDINTLNPTIIFPPELSYQAQFIDSTNYYINKDDTTSTTITLHYSGYGTFIHPDGTILCDVIQFSRTAPNHNGSLITTTYWYSKEARSPLAIHTDYGGESEIKRIEIKTIDFFNITEQELVLDTIQTINATKNCEFRVNFFPTTTCTEWNYDKVYIDYFNDGMINDTATFSPNTILQNDFKIGTHRLLFINDTDNQKIEKIFVVLDKRGPSIVNCCPGIPYAHLHFSNNSSHLEIKPTDFSTFTDNNCEGNLTLRIWLYDPNQDSPLDPDSLTLDQILNDLPETYFLKCFEERDQIYSAFVFAIDEAGNYNWSFQELFVESSNCSPICQIDELTKFSFQDINGQVIPDIQTVAYKKLALVDSLYQLRICLDDTFPTNFRPTPFEIPNIIEEVSTYDLLLIQQHILGKKTFTTFPQFAAADVNFSGTITTFDLLLIKEAILGKRNEFPNQTNWVFFEKEHNLLDKQPNIDVFPLSFAGDKYFELKDTTYHFLGIKLGDVSGQ